MFKYFDNKFNDMQSQLAENSRPNLSKRLRERSKLTSNELEQNAVQF